MVCYSVMDDTSFKSIEEWLRKLEEYGDISKMIKIVIGNKSDVEKHERRVDMRAGKAYAE